MAAEPSKIGEATQFKREKWLSKLKLVVQFIKLAPSDVESDGEKKRKKKRSKDTSFEEKLLNFPWTVVNRICSIARQNAHERPEPTWGEAILEYVIEKRSKENKGTDFSLVVYEGDSDDRTEVLEVALYVEFLKNESTTAIFKLNQPHCIHLFPFSPTQNIYTSFSFSFLQKS
ncbi:hypothetical protein K501DRAFT_275113 [Backusella circina FSU 941]|nr:hypothetical protein K501DRAFT_275113 [Backusella circina FSU 941]